MQGHLTLSSSPTQQYPIQVALIQKVAVDVAVDVGVNAGVGAGVGVGVGAVVGAVVGADVAVGLFICPVPLSM